MKAMFHGIMVPVRPFDLESLLLQIAVGLSDSTIRR
jgi:hypothetical protein